MIVNVINNHNGPKLFTNLKLIDQDDAEDYFMRMESRQNPEIFVVSASSIDDDMATEITGFSQDVLDGCDQCPEEYSMQEIEAVTEKLSSVPLAIFYFHSIVEIRAFIDDSEIMDYDDIIVHHNGIKVRVAFDDNE